MYGKNFCDSFLQNLELMFSELIKIKKIRPIFYFNIYRLIVSHTFYLFEIKIDTNNNIYL